VIAVERLRMATDETAVRTLLLVLVVLFLLPVLLMLLAVPMMGLWGGGHTWAWNGTAGIGWIAVLFWLFPLAVILGVGYLLYRVLVGSSSRHPDRALEELRVAYARGELSDEEFEKRRDRLRREDERH
jgi:putative membrane protein